MCFDDFIDSQNIGYSLLRNSLLNGKLSHAYLIDANDNENAFDFVLSFIKMIVCQYHFSNCNHLECKKCSICHRIDNNNYTEIKIIDSDSFVIKKEQLLELQSDFNKLSIEGLYRIYIIKNCDKMNKQAANSLLKFLEEPVSGVIAFLLTNRFNSILSTIISRCQVVRLNHFINYNGTSSLENLALVCCDSKNEIFDFISDESKADILNNVIDFLCYFEENRFDVLIFMKKMWYNNIQSRDDTLFAFKIIIYFYYDVLKFMINKNDLLFFDRKDNIKTISNYNSIDSIIKKLDIVQYGYNMILANLNINLLLDDILIRLGEVT